MKAFVNIGRFQLEVEGKNPKELFKEIALAHEIYGNQKCGLCGKEEITPVWRTVQDGKKEYEYPELRCENPACRAKLSFGLLMEGGGMFPQRKLDTDGKPDRENGKYGPHNGWTKYKGEKKEEKK